MATQTVPLGFHTVTPFLSVKDVKPLLEFARRAFGAEEIYRMNMPDGTIMHAEIKIGDSMVMVGDSMEDTPTRSSIYLYVEDADEVFRKAVEAGGKVVQEPKDQFYGDRNAGVRDPSGNIWWMATHKEDLSPEEREARADRIFGENPRD